MRRTKIVCTLGPASSSQDVLLALINAGMNVARLNFSHGTREDHARVFATVRAAAHSLGKHVALLQDLQGPKLRLGRVPGTVQLGEGQEVRLTPEAEEIPLGTIPVAYEHLAADVRIGGHVLIDDGRVDLRVEAVDGRTVLCRVAVGGLISAHKGVNLPGQPVSARSLTLKDLDDLRFGLALGVDYVAVSFVRSAADLDPARRVMQEIGTVVPIVAKIERPEALSNLASIVSAADGVMVARGDLGVEMPIEQVPVAQKAIIAEANRQGKPVITATQMLESMISNPGPTRAEASDVANAVFDGTDAVMLSAETALGAYPVPAVQMMARICEAAEQCGADVPVGRPAADLHRNSVPHAIAKAACLVAEQIGARAIITFTLSGNTALLVSKERPNDTILAVTPSTTVARLTALYWGVEPVIVEEPAGLDELLRVVEVGAVRSGVVHPGEHVVVLARASGTFEPGTNLMRIGTVEAG